MDWFWPRSNSRPVTYTEHSDTRFRYFIFKNNVTRRVSNHTHVKISTFCRDDAIDLKFSLGIYVTTIHNIFKNQTSSSFLTVFIKIWNFQKKIFIVLFRKKNWIWPEWIDFHPIEFSSSEQFSIDWYPGSIPYLKKWRHQALFNWPRRQK